MAKKKIETVNEELTTEVEVPVEVVEEVVVEEQKEFVVSSGRTYETRFGISRTDN